MAFLTALLTKCNLTWWLVSRIFSTVKIPNWGFSRVRPAQENHYLLFVVYSHTDSVGNQVLTVIGWADLDLTPKSHLSMKREFTLKLPATTSNRFSRIWKESEKKGRRSKISTAWSLMTATKTKKRNLKTFQFTPRIWNPAKLRNQQHKKAR